MTCLRCGSTDQWDDNAWYGCNSCGYAVGPDGGTMLFAHDKPGLARHLKDIKDSEKPARVLLVRLDPDLDLDD
jgi:hypothetical protein